MRRFLRVLWWGAWAFGGAWAAVAAWMLAQTWALPLWLAGLVAAGSAALAAAVAAWLWAEGFVAMEQRAARQRQQRYRARLAKLRAQVKALQQERHRLQTSLERTQKAVQRAQRAASQALARAQKAEAQAEHWRAQAETCHQQVTTLTQQVADLEAALQRAERSRALWEAVHRLETWEALPEVQDAVATASSPETLAQRLREAIQRLHEEREMAFGMAREAEDALQVSQARMAALQAQLEASQARLAACENERRATEARWQHLLQDLLDPQKDIVAVPIERWQAIAAYGDQRQAWDALLLKLRQANLREGQTKTLPGGHGGQVFPRGRQSRRVLFFEQPLEKRVLWVCRLWDTHEDDREYDTLTKHGAPRAEICPEPAAFLYWAPDSEL